ncbi:energy transducer TonB [Terrimonas sp. NA20]|uniref:Energy transducer TonB n=1 Tax=Terrimonas ginsenosidimutans TaxID=2908004 RepID=A0ABS9KLC8_9BACT|nr:energy transducer TonB [Terrimonas ginsenosidimutans]MCG2613137.1 energy transducer TonB [Terrimonas ginsenosidimutans]
MKINQLRTAVQGMATVFGFSLLMVACNNSDESANNSTTANSESAAKDSMDKATGSGATTPSGSTTVAAKKKGRASAAAMAAEDEKVKIEKDKMGIYTRAEVAPTYAGGYPNIESYIQDNIEYPQNAIDNTIEGTVQVQFAVDENGKVTNVSTVGNKLGYGLEEEAIKVVSNMPKWTPGKVKGKAVKTWRTLPITYQLES